MKKCHYCSKEIDYSEMYCSKNCEEKTCNYYKLRQKIRLPINIAYVIATIGIALGVLFAPSKFSIWGFVGIAAGGLIGGLITVLLPTPTDYMLKKHKMMKAMQHMRIYGYVFLAVGTIALGTVIVMLFT